MPRFRLFRRLRRRQTTSDDTPAEDEMVPFVPVTATQQYDEEEPDTAFPHMPEDQPRRRRRIARPALQYRYLLLALFLGAAGILGTLLKQDQLPSTVREWWPAVVLAGTVVWLLGALVQRHIASFLGASAIAGLGLSVLMDTQDIATFEETVMGVMLVTVGLGIVIRGFLLRQQTSA
jgi:hypothetical protein